MPRRSSSSVKVYTPKIGRARLITLLRRRVKSLSKTLGIRVAVLFGSYASGRYTAASDVDLFVVVENGHKDEAYRKIFESLNISNLQLHLYTLKEYERMKVSSPSFIKEMEKGVSLI